MNAFVFPTGIQPMAVFMDSPSAQPVVGLDVEMQHFSEGPLGFFVQSDKPMSCSLEEQLVLQLPPLSEHKVPAETVGGFSIQRNKNRAAAKSIFFTV